MTSRGRLGRWAAAQSNSDLYKFGGLLVVVGGFAYWTARSRGFWQDASDRFWTPVLVVVTVLPLLAGAIGALVGWHRGRASGRTGGLAAFLGGWWFAVTAILLALLRAALLIALVVAFTTE